MSVDYKYKVLRPIYNDIQHIGEALNKKEKIRMFDSLSSRFLYINKVTQTKASEYYFGDNNTCILDYITTNHKYIGKEQIDPEQFILKSNNLAYLPQFLYEVAENDSYSKKDLFLKPYKRYRKINDIVSNFKLTSIKISGLTLNFSPIEATSRFKSFARPNRKFKIADNGIFRSLSHGFLITSFLEHIFIYSDLDNKKTQEIYNKIKKFAADKYNFKLPDYYVLLEHEKGSIKNDIITSGEDSGIIAISNNDKIYNVFSNILEERHLAFKMLRLDTANNILKPHSDGIIGNFLLSFLLRAGNIPWLLEGLNYHDYLFLDVGRGSANYVGYSFTTDSSGSFTVSPSKPIKGEDLALKDLDNILDKLNFKGDSLIYIRDGKISKNEMIALDSIQEENNFTNGPLIEYKKAEPYRIFRKYQNRILKPNSGDCIILDKDNYVLVNSGAYEYNAGQGTPSTKLITFKEIKGNLKIENILQDIHSLCYLNWSTPNHIFSDPAPLHFMDNLLIDAGKGINRSFIPF
jgi:hypothetical protein